MAKMMAKKAGVDDSWFVEDGMVTEGTSNNAYIIKGNRIITRQLSHDILHGITRVAVLRFAREAQMEVEERSFTISEAQSADEAFIKKMASLLEAEGAAYDIAGYRDAPPGLRIWCGATVDTADIEALGPWLDWAYSQLTS